MRNRILLVIVLCLLCGASVAGQEAKEPPNNGGGGLVYGKNHMFAISAPKGWILDNVSGVGQGLYAVFYPEGSSWKNGAVVMYANTITRNQDKKETIDDAIEKDLKGYREDSPSVKISDADPLPTRREKHEAIVKYFTGDRNDNYEAVAYIGEKNVVVFLVLSAKTKKDYDSSFPAFKELVASYFLISDVVTMAHGQ